MGWHSLATLVIFSSAQHNKRFKFSMYVGDLYCKLVLIEAFSWKQLIATCTGPSPHRYPSLSRCLSFPLRPIPTPPSSSLPPPHHTGSLAFLKTSIRAWKGTRLRGAGTWRECRGCFCHSSASLVAADPTVVHPEETRLTSFWPGLRSTRAAR